MAKPALTFYSVLRMPIVDILQCARAAEEAGFGFISVAESFYRDGAALAATIACKTRAIGLGTGVFPIYTRTPFQLAMAVATLPLARRQARPVVGDNFGRGCGK